MVEQPAIEEFTDVYGEKIILQDQKRVYEKKEGFSSSLSCIAEAAEFIVPYASRDASPFGELGVVSKASEFDDLFRGTDVVAEIRNPLRNKETLVASIDITTGVSALADKLQRLLDNVHRSRKKLKYYRSPFSDRTGLQVNVEAITYISNERVTEALRLVAENEPFDNKGFRSLLAEQLLVLTAAMSQFARSVGNPKAANIYNQMHRFASSGVYNAGATVFSKQALLSEDMRIFREQLADVTGIEEILDYCFVLDIHDITDEVTSEVETPVDHEFIPDSMVALVDLADEVTCSLSSLIRLVEEAQEVGHDGSVLRKSAKHRNQLTRFIDKDTLEFVYSKLSERPWNLPNPPEGWLTHDEYMTEAYGDKASRRGRSAFMRVADLNNPDEVLLARGKNGRPCRVFSPKGVAHALHKYSLGPKEPQREVDSNKLTVSDIAQELGCSWSMAHDVITSLIELDSSQSTPHSIDRLTVEPLLADVREQIETITELYEKGCVTRHRAYELLGVTSLSELEADYVFENDGSSPSVIIDFSHTKKPLYFYSEEFVEWCMEKITKTIPDGFELFSSTGHKLVQTRYDRVMQQMLDEGYDESDLYVVRYARNKMGTKTIRKTRYYSDAFRKRYKNDAEEAFPSDTFTVSDIAEIFPLGRKVIMKYMKRIAGDRIRIILKGKKTLVSFRKEDVDIAKETLPLRGWQPANIVRDELGLTDREIKAAITEFSHDNGSVRSIGRHNINSTYLSPELIKHLREQK